MSREEREQLAHWRNTNARRSVEVLEIGSRVLMAGGLGDEEWSVREQLAFAALDMGALGLAESQIKRLRRKFPKSPRVSILEGMHLEVLGDPAGAKELYNILLKRDETNIAAHQRLIALLIPSGPSATIPALLQYLDTFYTDADAWTLLAEQYAESGLHAQALSAWGHVMLIQPWDSRAVGRAAGVAYTAGDYQLSLKHYLRAIEMSTPPEGAVAPSPSGTRLWWGVKQGISWPWSLKQAMRFIVLRTDEQCTKRLLDPASASDTTSTPSTLAPELHMPVPKLEGLAELATEQILRVKGASVEGEVLREVLGGKGGPR